MIPIPATAIKILGRTAPKALWRRHSSAARQAGLSRAFFILSFDCDTDRDIEVVSDVHARLASLGVTPVYAVPGELLERGAAEYRAIAASGAEFLNHGYRQHTDYDARTNSYTSTLFYDRMSREEIALDVHRGHDAVARVIGRRPLGFRTPHFGTFCADDQLTFLYSLLDELGYRYSTSSLPARGLSHGPAHRVAGSLWEFPVSGGFKWPYALLDSYGFRYHPGRQVREDDYVREMRLILSFFHKSQRPGILNYYADPSQVYDWPAFFETMAFAAPFAAKSYTALIEALDA